MSTEAQIAANRANAQHSTGPQSAAGSRFLAEPPIARSRSLRVARQPTEILVA
jgi:hypothetical protein